MIVLKKKNNFNIQEILKGIENQCYCYSNSAANVIFIVLISRHVTRKCLEFFPRVSIYNIVYMYTNILVLSQHLIDSNFAVFHTLRIWACILSLVLSQHSIVLKRITTTFTSKARIFLLWNKLL